METRAACYVGAGKAVFSELSNPWWVEHNAAHGLPWLVSGVHKVTGTLCALASFPSEERAEQYRERARRECRSHESFIITNEGAV